MADNPTAAKAAHIAATACMSGTVDATVWAALLCTFAYLGTEIREDVRNG